MNYDEALEQLAQCGVKQNGRWVSRCLNKEWFDKHNLTDLYDMILNETADATNATFKERLWMFEHLPLQYCECGNVARKHNSEDRWSDYCSRDCMIKSHKRINKMRETKNSQDYTSINNKRKQTMLAKYGVEYNSQRADVKTKLGQGQLDIHIKELLNNPKWLYEQYVVNIKSASEIASEIGCDYSTVLEYVRKQGWPVRQVYNKSLAEKQIASYIESLGFTVTSPTDKLSGKQEIDVYVESKRFGIEVDGLRYHSFDCKETKAQQLKHLNKTLVAQQNNIDLIHVTDHQWNNQQDIVKSIISSKLGINEDHIFARKCTIDIVSVDEARKFLTDNHIQGYVGSVIRLGLFYEGQLVSLATFGKPRYVKDVPWELLRFASIRGKTVVGGFSKLIHRFKRDNNGSIISYADRMRSNGNVYARCGFELVRTSLPGYFWTNGNVVISRNKCQKHKLEKWLLTYDSTKTEAENMFSAGYRRFWDCGQLVYIKN